MTDSSPNSINELISTIAQLRDPKTGCPWDLKQTHKTLRKYLIEEAYEACDAISNGSLEDVCEELGDVLLQVVLHAQIASEENNFDIYKIARILNEKMIRRHPHVFANTKVDGSDEVVANWEKIKEEEKKGRATDALAAAKTLLLGDEPKDAWKNGFREAFAIGKASKKADFDWDDSLEVLNQVRAELDELEVEIKNKNKEAMHDEVGDVLFTAIQLCRHVKTDPDLAIFDSNMKFMHRWSAMQEHCSQNQVRFSDLSRDQKEKLWNQIKEQAKV